MVYIVGASLIHVFGGSAKRFHLKRSGSRAAHRHESPVIRQLAALPYDTDPAGAMRILLITSRDTRRWVIPKGNPIKGLAPHRAAEHEAYEEAGISGIACPSPLGSYRYAKRRPDGSAPIATVEVFPLQVTGQAEDWPERAERDARWFSIDEAAEAVDEPDLSAIISSFREPPKALGIGPRFILWLRAKGEQASMIRWFQALMPKQGRFFEQFEEHAATLVAGADALARLLQGGPGMDEHRQVIFDREHDADDIIRDVLLDVRRTLVTPFDRSAITDLIGSMDDAIDEMNKTAKATEIFGCERFAPEMQDMAAIIVDAARITAETMPLLRSLNRNAPRLLELTERLVTLEGDADVIHETGLKTLFESADEKPMDFIVGREIYSHLEKVTDRFEDVANEIQGLVIDHA